SNSNQIIANLIGTDRSGTRPLGNRFDGVFITAGASPNVVGGHTAAAGNRIAFNGRHGIAVVSGVYNAILSNSIFSNTELGINLITDLFDQVTPNDPGDRDSGPNDFQNYPVLTSATSRENGVRIEGSLNSRPNGTFRLQFFANTSCDPSGHGEGERLLGARRVTTDENGNADFTALVATYVEDAEFITATATDAYSNTSEFSQCLPMGALATPSPTPTGTAGASPTATSTSVASPSATATVSATATASPTGTASATAAPTGTTTPAATTTMTSTPAASPTMTATATRTATVGEWRLYLPLSARSVEER
ncbi:MAG TPA: hypothetical protein VER55_05565, partial [Ardenticatenaceae bacterium]|nr:hypothetical protein [Ardenticatenaceae bacterium]